MVPAPKRKDEAPSQAPVQPGWKEALREAIQPSRIQEGRATTTTVLAQNHPSAMFWTQTRERLSGAKNKKGMLKRKSRRAPAKNRGQGRGVWSGLLEAIPIQAQKAERAKAVRRKPPEDNSESLSRISNWGPISDKVAPVTRRAEPSKTRHWSR